MVVPYYTIHKIMAGLLDAHHYLGNTLALGVAVKMAGYFENRLASLKPEEIEKIFRTDASRNPQNEFGAMSDVLAELFSITGERKQLAAGAGVQPLLVCRAARDGRRPACRTARQHTRCPGHRHCALRQSQRRHQRTGMASQKFWKFVTQRHSFVIGGNSFKEWFDKPGVETGASIDDHQELPATTAESCNTHNMLKLTRRLIEREAVPEERAAYIDYFERALYNHILSSVDPASGRVTYFHPLHGDFKTYLKGSECCDGSGIENTGRYNEGIYFRDDSSLSVNLYIPSVVDWKEKGLVIQQQGNIPWQDTVTFTITGEERQCRPPLISVCLTGSLAKRSSPWPAKRQIQTQSVFSTTKTWNTEINSPSSFLPR